ncbi:MAG: acetoin utilization protein AcuC [Aeromicrobium sp.]|jgi:acetoin utilization protein AcuC|uniref:acetoin utilization protein AcuC n=1 Tax=Aeromicrobium sp. TaxID=1871063 RepID=UPI00260237A0|nr:acetoin utilization protein AcuC [Aeromicrobium sp.]MCW2789829.1 acetoin utilization protein AcuC [Aeromicrobium sp.]MCW2823830.1 acetoin utilization protein AcuC [Aeromicrobium sp.]
MTDGRACVVFDEHLTQYNFGQAHPMAPVRIELTMDLARELGVIDGLDVVGAQPATEDELNLIHTANYIERVRKLSDHPIHADTTIGLGSEDNPVFPHMHEASSLIAGASVEAARRVWTGAAPRAINISGGLHHAMPGNASGFCIYNDVALAIRWLLDNGAERVAYVDVDAHHGDGVQKMFWNDPRVLTISIHEGPQTLFPGTGFSTETGGEGAEGSAVNVPLPPGTSDAGWLRAFHAVVPPLVREFAPDILVTQQGCDSHMDDPLTNLMLSVDGQRASYLALRDLAEEVCDGKWVATGGGGYAVMDVVPRAWSHLLAIVSGVPLDPSTLTPEKWQAHIAELRGAPGPARMTDGRSVAYRAWERGYDPASWLDRSIHATRAAVFPLHGLDPQP